MEKENVDQKWRCTQDYADTGGGVSPFLPMREIAEVACCRSPDGQAAQGLMLEQNGFVVLRGVLQPALADELREHVNKHLDATLKAFDAGEIHQEEAFGAIAPGKLAPKHRWNVLLPMDKVVEGAIREVLVHSEEIFESACGADASICDLSALVVDPGSEEQRTHYDTRFSDVEEEDSDEKEEARARKQRVLQKRLVTAFVALQDVTIDMGPTVICRGTANEAFHRKLEECSNEEQVCACLQRIEERDVKCVLSQGDVVLMDSRAFHRGSANTSTRRRILLDFAFVGPRSVPSTYCQCIKSEVKGRYFLKDFRTSVHTAHHATVSKLLSATKCQRATAS